MGSVSKRTDRHGRPSGWLTRWREADGRQRKKAFLRKVDADRFLLSVEHSSARGAYVPPDAGRGTVGEWGRAWLAGRVDLTPKSRSSVESLWRSRVEPRWGAVRLDAVRHEDVARWLADMVAEGLSASRVRQSFHVLTGLLDAAVRARKIAHNEAQGVALPRLKVTERRFLDHDAVARLADAAGTYRPLVLVLAYCGLRWGEAVALRRRDLDMVAGRILVQRAVVDVDGVMVEGAPKTHERRAVPVPRFVLDVLAEHVASLAPDDLVFPAPRGGYLRNQNARRAWWNRAAADAGLPGLVPHELRHTAASLAIASGADILTVARMLGHASPSMTLDRYGHLVDSGLDDVAERLNAAGAPHSRPKRSRKPSPGKTISA